MIIAVDAAGGDYAPHEIVKGAIKAAEEFKAEIALVGRKDILHVLAGKHVEKLGISIVDAQQVIDFNESPVDAVNNKPQSSIVVGTKLVKDGVASAFISAGSTGAVFYAALSMLGKVTGIERPAIGTIIQIDGSPSLLLDSGANADCRPNFLVQFAQLGNIYAKAIFDIPEPRIGLLSNGQEEHKGNHLTREAHQLLKKTRMRFIGNIEGQDISRGVADVVVTDGFTGNVVLKTLEGLGEAFLKVRAAGQPPSKDYRLNGRALLTDVGLGSIVKRMDYREFGGASLLGVNGNIIISHGRSKATAIKNAIRLARRSVERNINQKIKEETYEQASSDK